MGLAFWMALASSSAVLGSMALKAVAAHADIALAPEQWLSELDNTPHASGQTFPTRSTERWGGGAMGGWEEKTDGLLLPSYTSMGQQQLSHTRLSDLTKVEVLPHSRLDIGENLAQMNSDRQRQPKPHRSPSPDSTSDPNSPSNAADTPQIEVDPELGILRLRQREVVPETLPPVPQAQPEPILNLLPRITYYQTDNVFSGVDPIGDGFILTSLMLWSVPQIRPGTNLTASVDGNLIRYNNQGQFNYNFYRFRAGIRQRLPSQTFGEIGWTNQQFFLAETGDRFLGENSPYLSLSRRDLLARNLVLDSYYDFRATFADPDSRSRLINSLYLSLSYYFQPNLQVGLDYHFNRSDYTQQDRLDQYHRIMGRVTYGVLSDSQISFQGGVSIGDSSNPFVDFNSLFFSVNYSVNFPIFR